jgi:tRNA pseudouridine synthase 10
MKLVDMVSEGEIAEIQITGESGIYIKELITGDSGRTNPSFSELLGTECTVHELDVVKINDDE